MYLLLQLNSNFTKKMLFGQRRTVGKTAVHVYNDLLNIVRMISIIIVSHSLTHSVITIFLQLFLSRSTIFVSLAFKVVHELQY